MQRRQLEQRRLRIPVLLETTVVVEMILRQVGENCGIEFQAGDSPLRQSVGRHFHGRVTGGQRAQRAVQGQTVWRR